MNSKRIALIPAYEPDERLVAFAEELKREDVTVIVVNDGSDAGSADVFREAAHWAQVLTHPHNRGKGAALKTGLQYIAAHFDAPYTVVTADADGQHKTYDVLRVCTEAESHPDSRLDADLEGLKDILPGLVKVRACCGNDDIEEMDSAIQCIGFTITNLKELRKELLH